VIRLQVLDQLNEYLRHGRQTGNQQSIANVMVRLMHRIQLCRQWSSNKEEVLNGSVPQKVIFPSVFHAGFGLEITFGKVILA
ncbi:hypothetical protein, partial [Pseudomonas viridiflava]|uniref:hypothetical protein n=1 Tax=Pseudomonas viridiflava TaxID=33069 RepID=UPI0013DF994F